MKTTRSFLKFGLMAYVLVFTSCAKEFETSPNDLSSPVETQDLVKGKSTMNNLEKEVDEIDMYEMKEMLRSIDILSALEYPIKDWHTFKNAVWHFKDPTILEIFEKSISEKDFPLSTLQAAFEVHYSRHPSFTIARPIFPKLPSLGPELPVFVDQPSACEIFQRDFSPEAARCGCSVYAQTLRSTRNNWQAILAGIFAARRFERTGECW